VSPFPSTEGTRHAPVIRIRDLHNGRRVDLPNRAQAVAGADQISLNLWVDGFPFPEWEHRRISMRPTHIILASVAALFLATPASAQWGDDRTYSHQLLVQIDLGVGQGTISRPESVGLRESLNRLVRLERRFSPNGISGREYSVLMQRSAALEKEIRLASRNHGGRDNQPIAWESRSINGHWVPDARFAGLHPGDRFSGDTRVGQRVTARIVSMPVQHRSEYVDTDQIYYGYDSGRVYQINRKSQMILALLDIAP
jgi:hypothetical protein